MAKMDAFDREQQKTKTASKITEQAKSSFSGTYKVTDGGVTSRYLANEKSGDHAFGSLSKEQAKSVESAIEGIFHNTAQGLVQADHAIAESVTNFNSWQNPAQYVGTMFKSLREGTKVGKHTIFSMDTEWLGGGMFGSAMPVELGINPIEIVNGQIQKIERGQAITLAVQLSKEDADMIGALIKRLEDAKAAGIKPPLNDDEYRTLKDLINYGGETSIDAHGRIDRVTQNSMVNKQNIMNYINEIKDGFSVLDPNGVTSKTKALKRVEFASKVAELVRKGEYTIGNDPTFVWHNGLNTDVNNWEKAFGADVAKVFGFGGSAKHIDTLTYLKAMNPNLIDMYKDVIKKGAKIKGAGKLETIAQYILNEDYVAHVAGEDARVGAMLFQYIWNQNKDIDVSGKTYKGKKMFSTGSIQRNVANNPFDVAFAIEQDGKLQYRNQNISTYKNAIHKINKEFEYQFGGKKYYGVVLHNIDDDIYSVVARENLRDLQNVIQANFTSVSKMSRNSSKDSAALRHHVIKTRAIGEYNRMFNGEYKSYGMFEKYMGAISYIKEANLDSALKDGVLNTATINKLVSEGKLTHAQAQKFKFMYNRLNSEYDLLNEARNEFNKFENGTQKSTALHLYKSELDSILGEEGVELTEKLDISKLSKDAYNQARIYDPVAKAYKTVDVKSASTFANSLYNIAMDGSKGNPNFNLADAKYRLNKVVHQLAAENTIEAGKAKELLSVMHSVIGSENGPGGAHQIAEYLAVHLLPEVQQNKIYNVIDNQQKMSAISISRKTRERVENSSLAKSVYHKVNNFFNVEGTLAFYDSKLPSKLKELDSSIRKHVGKFSDVVANNPNLGPTSILENLENLVASYYNEGIGVDVRMAEDKKKTGLIMTLYDRETTSRVFSPNRSNSAEIFIPLLNPKTGLLTVDGVDTVNILRVVKRNGGAALETYQNKAFEVLRMPGVSKEIVDMIKNGNIVGAQKRAKSTLKWAMKGLPSGSRYHADDLDDLNSSTKLANKVREGTIDFNDLIYAVTGESFHDMKDRMGFLRQLGHHDDSIEYFGGRNAHAREIRRLVTQGLGLQYDVSGIKGERAQLGFFSHVGSDPRTYIPFGYHNDNARENAKQALQYYKFADDDIMRIPDSSSASGYRIAKRSDVLAGFSENKRRRLTGTFIATEKYVQDAVGETMSYNLNTAFLTDDYIHNLATSHAGKQAFLDLDIVKRLTTHDDTMIIRDDVAHLFTAMKEKTIHLPSEYNIRGSLEAGQWINQGWSLSEAVPGMKNFTYDGKYDAQIKDIVARTDGDGYDVVLNQVIGFREGMKLQGGLGGNKFTAHIAIKSEKEIVNALGPEFKEIEAIAAISTKKMPTEIMNSQVALLMTELNKKITVGKMKTAEAKAVVDRVLETMLSNGSSVAKRARIDKNGTLIVPDKITNAMFPKKTIDKVGQILKDMGVSSNVVKEFKMNDDTTATKILRGIVNFRRVDQEDWVKTSQAHEGLVKYTWRELEMIKNRAPLIGNDVDLSGIMGAIQSRMKENSQLFNGEGQKLAKALAHGSGIVDKNSMNVPIVKTRGHLNSDKVAAGLQKDFSNIVPLPSESRGYLASEIDGTVLDPKLFNGKSFYMELPTVVRIDGKEIDKVLMPALHINGKDGDIFPAGVQQAQRGIYEAIKDWRGGFLSKEQEKAGQRGYHGATPEQAKKLEDRMTNAVDRYYTALGHAVGDPHGYIMQNQMTTRMEHSGHFTYGAANPNIEKLGLGRGLVDGEALISRHDLRGMLDGIGDKRIEQIMKQAETKGFTGIGNRYPTKEFSSVLPLKLKVMTAEAEAEVEKHLGARGLVGNIITTVGTQMRHGADHDSDTMAVVLPQLAGKKVSTTQSKIIEQQLDNWYDKEQKTTQVTGEYFRQKIYPKGIEIADEIQAIVGDTGLDHILGLESRYIKEVGKFSNMNTKYRKMAETVGTMTKDMTTYQMLTYFGNAIEQMPISYKRIPELIARDMKDVTDPNLINKKAATYIGAVNNFFTSLQNNDIRGIIDNSRTLGFMQQGDNGEWYFEGATKAEGERAAIELGRYSRDAEGKIVVHKIRESEIREALETTKQYVGKDAVNSQLNKLGASSITSSKQAFAMINAIYNPNATTPMISGSSSMLLHNLGQDATVEQIMNAAAKNMNVKAYLETPGGSTASNILHDAPADIETVGSTVASALKGAAGEALGNIKTSAGLYGAVALGGMWAAGAMMGGPDRIREVNQGIPDQAPSSDGQYIDPTPYAAGAPMGAGPTARLAPKGHQRVNIKIDARSMSGLTNEEIAQVVSQEVQRQSGMNLNINVTSQDDRTSIDKSWLQEQFASALKSGFVY